MNIAVVIATYNQSDYVAEAIDSVIQQTQLPDQIIITDDGSKDGTQNVIKQYAHRYSGIIDTRLSEENEGIAQNFNHGLRAASADAVTFLAGDDRYRPEKIETEASKLNSEPDIGVAFSNFAYINQAGEELDQWTNSHPPEGTVLKQCLAREWPKNTLFRNPMVSMDILSETGLFDEDFKIYEDWDLKIRMSNVTNIVYCDEILTEYRRHSDGMSQLPKDLHAESYEMILNKHDNKIAQLNESEHQYVKKRLKYKLHKYYASAARETGDWRFAVLEYLRSIYFEPDRATAYTEHLRFFLPKRIFDQLVQAKSYIDNFSN